jgi:prephenate dehydrogenase
MTGEMILAMEMQSVYSAQGFNRMTRMAKFGLNMWRAIVGRMKILGLKKTN